MTINQNIIFGTISIRGQKPQISGLRYYERSDVVKSYYHFQALILSIILHSWISIWKYHIETHVVTRAYEAYS